MSWGTFFAFQALARRARNARNFIAFAVLLAGGCAAHVAPGATSTGEACSVGDQQGIAVEAPQAPSLDCPQMKTAKGASPKWCCLQ